MGKIFTFSYGQDVGPQFSHLLTVRAEGANPPPLTVSLTVKRPFFYDSSLSYLEIVAFGIGINSQSTLMLLSHHRRIALETTGELCRLRVSVGWF